MDNNLIPEVCTDKLVESLSAEKVATAFSEALHFLTTSSDIHPTIISLVKELQKSIIIGLIPVEIDLEIKLPFFEFIREEMGFPTGGKIILPPNWDQRFNDGTYREQELCNVIVIASFARDYLLDNQSGTSRYFGEGSIAAQRAEAFEMLFLAPPLSIELPI